LLDLLNKGVLAVVVWGRWKVGKLGNFVDTVERPLTLLRSTNCVAKDSLVDDLAAVLPGIESAHESQSQAT
jgi:hypothetical protein